MPEKKLLEQGLTQANTILKQRRPASASYYLSPLLPLSCRLNDQDCIKQVMRASEAYLDAMAGVPKCVHGFLNSLEKSLEQGFWPDQKQGQRLLDILNAQIES